MLKQETFNMNYCSWVQLQAFCTIHDANIIKCGQDGLVTVEWIQIKPGSASAAAEATVT
jgi:hypothetical protein